MRYKNIYNIILGEEFMNSQVQGTIEESEFMKEKVNEFKNKLKNRNYDYE